MTKAEFISNIKSSLQYGCNLPYSIPDSELLNITNRVKKWFYINYEDAVEHRYYVIPCDMFQCAAFKNSRMIKMPPCVVSVWGVNEIKGGARFYDINQYRAGLVGYELNFTTGADYSDDIMYRVAHSAFWDLNEAFFIDSIAYQYNMNSKNISIIGRDPKANVAIKTYSAIDDEALFEDYYFTEFVLGEAELALGKLLGFFTYKLPGGIEINSDTLRDSGRERIDRVKEEIDGKNSADFMMYFH